LTIQDHELFNVSSVHSNPLIYSYMQGFTCCLTMCFVKCEDS